MAGKRTADTTAVDEPRGDVTLHGGESTGDQHNAGSVLGDATEQRGVIDPATIGGTAETNPDGTPKRKRGRPAGSGNKAKSAGGGATARKAGATSKATDSIANMLFSVHMMGSAFLSIQELAITEEEAKQLAKAISDVSEHYDVPLVDDKTMAWVNLAMVMGGVYGTRFASIVMTGKKKKAATPQVVQMPGFVSPHAAKQ